MKEQSHLAATLHRLSNPVNQKNGFVNQIESHKRTISQIKAKHEEKLKSALLESQHEHIPSNTRPQSVSRAQARVNEAVTQTVNHALRQAQRDTKNGGISDTDKMLFQKKFKNFLNHRQQFQEKAKYRQRKIMQDRKNKQSFNPLLNQQSQDDYIDKQQLLKDTKGENQFQNAQQMIAFYEEITFGKKNKKNSVHLYHAEKIEYQFRREEFEHLIQLESGSYDNEEQQNHVPIVTTSIKKDTVLSYLFDEPCIMMLYSINPYLFGDQLAQFQTTLPNHLTFQQFSNFLLIDRQPTYFQYSKQTLTQARKLGRGIKCQPIIAKWIGDQEMYQWLIELFRGVDVLGQEQVEREVLVRKIRKQAEKKRVLDEEIVEIVNINKLITLDRILYEIQYSSSESANISLQQFDGLLRHYHRLPTPQKDKLITKLILAGKYDPSYVFILGNEPIEIIKETFHSIQKFAQYFVPKEKFIQKLVKNPKFNKIRTLPVRSQTNRYVKKQTIEQTLARFLNQAQPFVDIQEVVEFFTNRGRPRKVEYQIYIANLQAQIARIEQEERKKQQKKLSQGDYSTSSDQEEFQKSIKQKAIQRKKEKLASIRASQKFTQGKKFNVTVPNTFSFGDGTKQKNKVSIRQKKLKQQLDQKRKIQDQAMKPIPPKPVPQHVKQDLYQKIMRQQQRQRKQRLQRFRIQIQQSMYPISPHLLSKPRSKSIYEHNKEQYRFIAKPLPWYCQVNLLERIQKEKDQRRQRILEEIINKHSEYDLPEGVKKMFEREAKSKSKKERMRAQSQTTANAPECTFQPRITGSIPDFQMIHQHLHIDLENRKQQKKPIQVVPFSFENRPHRSRTTMQPNQNQPLHHLKKSKQSQIPANEVNIPITEKHLALINLRRKQQQDRAKKLQQQKRASTVRRMRQQKFAPYVREVLRKSRVGDVAHSRAIIESKIQQFKKEQRKRKRQYEQEMIKIYTKVFNRPLLVEGQGQKRDNNQSGQGQSYEPQPQARNLQSRGGQRNKQKNKQHVKDYAQDYEMEPSPADQYSKRNPQQDDYDDMRRKAIQHPPRNYLMEEPEDEGEGHYDEEEDFEGEYLSENGRYTN